MKKLSQIILYIALSLHVSACVSDQENWKKANELNTVESYYHYIKNTSSVRYVDDAFRKIIELKWNQVIKLDTLNAYKDFLEQHSRSKYTKEAQARIEDFHWEHAKSLNTMDSYLTFVANYPESKHIENAYSNTEQLILENIINKNEIDEYFEYLTKYPNGYHKKKAQDLVEQLLLKQACDNNDYDAYNYITLEFPKSKYHSQALACADELLWEKVSRINTIESYAEYIMRFKDGINIRNAFRRHEELLWTLAESIRNDIGYYEYYLTEYPNGKYSEVAKDCLSWYSVEQNDTIVSYRNYLKAHPKGRFINNAQKNISQLKDVKVADKETKDIISKAGKYILEKIFAYFDQQGTPIECNKAHPLVVILNNLDPLDDEDKLHDSYGYHESSYKWTPGYGILTATTLVPSESHKRLVEELSDRGEVFVNVKDGTWNISSGNVFYSVRDGIRYTKPTNVNLEFISGRIATSGMADVGEYMPGTKCKVYSYAENKNSSSSLIKPITYTLNNDAWVYANPNKLYFERSACQEQLLPFVNAVPLRVPNSIGMQFIHIESGYHYIGKKNQGLELKYTNEFQIAISEVSQKQWYAVMKTKPWKKKYYVKEGNEYPAVYVYKKGAEEFCKKLSEMEGILYRLPTQVEWECACRCNTTTKYSFGNDKEMLCDYAWFQLNTGEKDTSDWHAHKIKTKKPNPWGLYDMHGNVSEYCIDGVRGGSFKEKSGGCTSGNQVLIYGTGFGPSDCGFRVVREYGN